MNCKRSIAIALLLPAIALAHAGERLQPDDLASAWEFDPGVVIPLAISGLLYARGTYIQRVTARRQNLYFWCGWALLAVALVSPLHPLGEVLFSVHMIQHEVLMLAAAPLFVLSRPLATFLFALPFEWRRSLGQFAKTNYVRGPWSFLTDPLTAWGVHAAAIWIWHAPFMFELTLKSELAHTAQHLSFFLSALFFWWALFYAHGRKAYGPGVLYVFTTAVHTSILGALLTFAPRLWYPAYSTTTEAWGLTPLEDQQIGGLIMWVPAALVYLAAGLWLFAGWLRESDAMLERTRSAK